MHALNRPNNFPSISPATVPGGSRAGGWDLYLVIFLHGALTGLAALALIALLTGGGL
jgi:hypothetical protein